ncbi:MAG: SDR family NAD(P)-dependent oxidoreductase [Planctomycetia bacterium]
MTKIIPTTPYLTMDHWCKQKPPTRRLLGKMRRDAAPTRNSMNVMNRFRLDGKRVFITGGSRGLGREIAIACAEAGADLILVGRSADDLTNAAAAVRLTGRNAVVLTADVGVPDECEAVCLHALAEHGPIDVVVNNVGGRRVPTPTAELSLDDWRFVLDLNLTSTFLCTKRLGGAMVERAKRDAAEGRTPRGGRIVNVASVSGLIVNRGIGGRAYETSKAAVLQFTRTVAADWAPFGITANAICPGGFMTEPNQRWAAEKPEVIASFKSQIPMGDFGRPEDLGPLAVYLASDASRYMTGAALVIDGGYTLW